MTSNNDLSIKTRVQIINETSTIEAHLSPNQHKSKDYCDVLAERWALISGKNGLVETLEEMKLPSEHMPLHHSYNDALKDVLEFLEEKP